MPHRRSRVRAGVFGWAFLGITMVAVQPASAADVKPNIAGNWTIHGSVQGVEFTDVCVLAQKDDAITGTCHLEDGKPREVKGTAGEKNITLTHAGEYQGDALTLTFTGTLAADGTLSGSVDVDPQNVSGGWKGTRTEPEAAPPATGTPKPPSANGI